MQAGFQDEYRWLTSRKHDSETLLQCCPDIFLQRFLAFTTIDSGIPELNERSRNSGWVVCGGVAYSPQINAIAELHPEFVGYDPGGFNECYVFDSPRQVGVRSSQRFQLFQESSPVSVEYIEPFVTWPAFDLSAGDGISPVLNERFWSQIRLVQPVCYIADGWEQLSFVSKDKQLFDAVYLRLGQSNLSYQKSIGTIRM